MLCKGCKREIKNDSVYCEYCGRNVKNDFSESFCSSCGKPLDSGAVFCKYCGKSVNDRVNYSVNYSVNYKQSDVVYPKKRWDGKKSILLSIAVIIAVCVCFCLFVKEETTIIDVDEVICVNGVYYSLIDETLMISGEGEVDKETINSFSKDSYDSVVFEYGNINIPNDTFSGFSNIKNIELKNVVGEIGARAFKGCGFDLIAIGKSISEIGEDAFAECSVSCVYLNNPEIRANLNKRDDFGRLFEKASTIAIYYSTTQSADEDFTLEEDGWGQYLKYNEEYSTLQKIYSSANTLTGRNYNLWAHAFRPGFFHFNYNVGGEADETLYLPEDYDAETNTLTFE